MVDDHDHSKCEPNEVTKKTLEEVMEEIRNEREERTDRIVESIVNQNEDMSAEERLKFINSLFEDEFVMDVTEKLGSDYDEDGVPYWEKMGNKDTNE